MKKENAGLSESFDALAKKCLTKSDLKQIDFLRRLLKATGCPSAETGLEAAIILLEETSCKDPAMISGLLLYYLCKESSIFDDHHDYRRFCASASYFLNLQVGPAMAKAVLEAAKPSSQWAKQTGPKSAVIDIPGPEAMLIRLLDKLRKIRAYVRQEKERGFKDPRPTAENIIRFQKKLNGLFLPLTASLIKDGSQASAYQPILSLIKEKIEKEIPELKKLSTTCRAWFFPVKYEGDDLEYRFYPDFQKARTMMDRSRNNRETDGKPQRFLVNPVFHGRLLSESAASVKANMILASK